MSAGKPYRSTRSVGKYIILLLLLLCCFSSFTQGLINQTNLYIPESIEVHLDGDLLNSGFIQNSGSLHFTGHWRNSNVYQGSGTIIAEGSDTQNISNNKNAVHHLVVDGAGPVNINDKLPVTGQLDLLAGIVNVADNDTLLLEENASVSGGSPASYVDGALTSEGVGYKFFPIGKNGNYYPVEMLNITGIKSIIELEVFENLPAVTAPSNVTLYRRIYWQRKDIRGTFLGSPLALGYQIPDGYTDTHQIEVVQGDDVSQPFRSLGTATVEFGNEVDKVESETQFTGKIVVIGESIPVDGMPGEFYISTSLSPHAANPENRLIKVFGNRLMQEDFLFVVYNRWGLVVYENRSLPDMIAKGWDGKRNGSGEILPAGAYPFILKAMTKEGKVMEQKGVVAIVN